MAEVTGSIGNEYVELNNAATESTLRLLLQSSLAANKQTIDSISKIATKAGIDPATVAATNLNISSLGRQAFMLGAAWGGLSTATDTLRKNFSGVNDVLTELTSGGAEASKVLSIMGRIGGPLGLVLDGMSRLAAFQETTLAAYQSMTSAGVNFGGSLTQLRLAASQSYLTLAEFTNLMKTNSATFSIMGDNVNQGAMAFSKFSKTLISSPIGDELRALGYTFGDLNRGALSYIAATGGRTKAELTSAAGTAALVAGTASYLEQLDRLSQITGKNREEQEAELKRLSMQAAWENYIAKLRLVDPKAADKAVAGLAEASARGGKRMAENFQAYSLGLQPATEANAKFAGMLQQGDAALRDLVATTKDGSKTVTDVYKNSAGITHGLVQDSKNMGNTAVAISLQGKEGAEAADVALKAQTKALNNNLHSLEDHKKQVDEVTVAQQIQKTSEADNAAKTQKAVNELGQSIMEKLMPAIASILSGFNSMLTGVISLVEWISKSTEALTLLLGATAALTGAFIFAKVVQAKQAAADLLKTGGRARGTPGAPMHVLVTNPGGGGGGGGIDIEAPDDKGGKGGKGKLLKGLKGFGVGAAVGIGSDLAADALGRDTKSGAGADVLGTAAGMAGTGALLGSFVPGIGTAIGAGIGGAAGAGLGLYQNWGTLFGENKNNQVPTLPKASDSAVIKDVKESVAPLTDPKIEMAAMETLRTELQTLNKQSAEMLKYIKDTTDYTRRTFDATSALSGNHFKR
jgi:hypothetical protein